MPPTVARPATGTTSTSTSTKTLDYRALLFTGSRFDADALEVDDASVDSHVVSVGGRAGRCDAVSVRYPGDDDPIVALLTEVLVAELLAAHWWLASADHAT